MSILPDSKFTEIEFESPANRIISQFAPKDKFGINTSLPDIAFLRQLSVQGRLRYFFATSTGTGANEDVLTITPPSGETFFFITARYDVLSDRTIQLLNDGEVREQYAIFPLINSFVISNIKMDSLVGDGTKSIIVRRVSTGASGDLTVNLMGWVENTSRIRDVAT